MGGNALSFMHLYYACRSVSSAVPAGKEEAFVRFLYQHYLGRDPEPSALTAWTNYIKAVGPVVACQGVARSAEARGRYLRGLYQSLLKREPSDAEITAWVGNQVPLSTCEEYFVSSQEFLDKLEAGPAPGPGPGPTPPPL